VSEPAVVPAGTVVVVTAVVYEEKYEAATIVK
jgi:hypothetical protein